jgi:ABC-type bacteriocin/lantibiotic exporter with double-glycine peptidase domain
LIALVIRFKAYVKFMFGAEIVLEGKMIISKLMTVNTMQNMVEYGIINLLLTAHPEPPHTIFHSIGW